MVPVEVSEVKVMLFGDLSEFGRGAVISPRAIGLETTKSELVVRNSSGIFCSVTSTKLCPCSSDSRSEKFVKIVSDVMTFQFS